MPRHELYDLPVGWRGPITSDALDTETGILHPDFTYNATATGQFRFDEDGTLRRLFTDCEPWPVPQKREIWLGVYSQWQKNGLRKVKAEPVNCEA